MLKKDWDKMFPYFLGVSASLGLLAFYIGIMTLTGDWYYAQTQFEHFRWWIIALSIGVGIQSILFVLLRRGLKGKERNAARSTLVASGSVSSASMVVCCLHHLTDLVPVLEFSVLAAGLQKYQTLSFLGGYSPLYSEFPTCCA